MASPRQRASGLGQLGLTTERLHLYSGALLAAIVVAFALALVLADGVRLGSGRLGGDFAAFYGAGALVLAGDGASLYRWEAQAAVQAPFLPTEAAGAFLPFPYPPFVAVPYAALAALPFLVAYTLHTLLAGLAVGLAVRLGRAVLPGGTNPPFVVFVAVLFLYPMFRAVTGGQNTAFSLLLVMATWVALARDRPVWAGVWAALLLGKPQLALPVLGVLTLHTPRALGGAVPTAIALGGLGAWVMGPGWLRAWTDQLGAFQLGAQAIDARISVGLLGFFEALFGVGSLEAQALGAGSALALVAMVVALWRRPTDLATRMGVLGAALVLLPPHSLYYDAGLVAVPLLVLLERGRARLAMGLGLATYTGALDLPVSLLPLVVIAAALAVYVTRPTGTTPSTGPAPG